MHQVPKPNTRQKQVNPERVILFKKMPLSMDEKKEGGKLINYSYRGEKPCLRTFPYRKTIFGSVAQTGQT
jgi:hypothetical protein